MELMLAAALSMAQHVCNERVVQLPLPQLCPSWAITEVFAKTTTDGSPGSGVNHD